MTNTTLHPRETRVVNIGNQKSVHLPMIRREDLDAAPGTGDAAENAMMHGTNAVSPIDASTQKLSGIERNVRVNAHKSAAKLFSIVYIRALPSRRYSGASLAVLHSFEAQFSQKI
jgi:hypothetical protein